MRLILCCLVLPWLVACDLQQPDRDFRPPQPSRETGASTPATDTAGEGKPYVQVTEGNFATVVLGSSQPVLVDFYADWCGPCRRMSPVVEELAREYQGRVTVAKVNVDHNPALAKRYRIRGIPAFVMFANGQEVRRLVGAGSKQELVQMIAAAQ